MDFDMAATLEYMADALDQAERVRVGFPPSEANLVIQMGDTLAQQMAIHMRLIAKRIEDTPVPIVVNLPAQPFRATVQAVPSGNGCLDFQVRYEPGR